MSLTVQTNRISIQVIILILVAATTISCGAGRQSVRVKKSSSHSLLQDQLISYSIKYLGKPYRYAGRGPHSFDCAGFTRFVFREFGYNLDAGSAAQERQFPAIDDQTALRKGDLVFFEGRNRNGTVGHVGIVTEVDSNGKFRFIHASTSQGVIISSSTEPYYAARYLNGGRVLEAVVTPSPQQSEHRKEEKVNNMINQLAARNCNFMSENLWVREKGKQDRSVTMIQEDTSENESQKMDQTAKKQEGQQNSIASENILQAVLREESTTVPEPVVIDLTEIERATLASFVYFCISE